VKVRVADLLECDVSRPVDDNIGIEGEIGKAAVCRVLRKKESREAVLRRLFQDCGATLNRNVKLERCSRRTACDEDEFVRFYPYLPHLIDLAVDIVAGIRRHPDAREVDGGDRAIVRLFLEMLVSDRTRIADQPLGVLVSIDRFYEPLAGNIPPEKRKCIDDIRQRFDNHEDYPGMAARIAKTICLMELATEDLPRTTGNIAALLIQRVIDTPPTLAVTEILYLMQQARFIRETDRGWKLFDLGELRSALAALEGYKKAVGIVNPRPPGWHNDLLQHAKRLLARAMSWYTRPLHEYNASLSRSIEEVVWAIERLSADMVTTDRLSMNTIALDHLSMDMVALERRLAQSERRNADRFDIDTGTGSDRTAYVLGLFGTGRRYINELIVCNIGERARYFRDTIRLHPGPTPMIYSGHATIRYDSRLQYPPAITSRVSDAVRSGYADSVLIYRHPLDSLLTNWIWWRTYIRDNRAISGISELYEDADGFCAVLDRNFSEFEAFAEGDPDFFAGAPGPGFLSFPEFVEETELHLQSATLALRLEDFMIDPFKEFCRIAAVMSVDLDSSRLCMAPPKSRPYGYMAVRDKVPRFRNFIDGLDVGTRRRIDKAGYGPG
jgi:hypothetical protein